MRVRVVLQMGCLRLTIQRNLIASKYQDLYTSVSYDSAGMDSLRNEVSAQLAKNGYDQHCVVSASSVIDAISKLKSGKGDGNTGISTDNFKHA